MSCQPTLSGQCKHGNKLPGTASSDSSAKSVREEPASPNSTAQVRQYYGSSVHQQSGRDSVEGSCLSDTGLVDVVPGKEHTHRSPAPTWGAELCSRQRVETHEGPIRLEIRSGNIYENQPEIRSTGSGHVCIEANQSVPSLFQLAARSICRGDRCVPPLPRPSGR